MQQVSVNGKDYYVAWAYLDTAKTQQFISDNAASLVSRVTKHPERYSSAAICRFKIPNADDKPIVEFWGASFCRVEDERGHRRDIARKNAFQHALERSGFSKADKAKAWTLFLAAFPPIEPQNRWQREYFRAMSALQRKTLEVGMLQRKIQALTEDVDRVFKAPAPPSAS